MANIVSFSPTPEKLTKYAERGLIKQVTAGRLTEADAALIRESLMRCACKMGQVNPARTK